MHKLFLRVLFVIVHARKVLIWCLVPIALLILLLPLFNFFHLSDDLISKLISWGFFGGILFFVFWRKNKSEPTGLADPNDAITKCNEDRVI